MIDKLRIWNFQSHRDTSIEFSPGVNILTGNSDCGKSSVMRSLIWAITNSPSGDAFVRNDIRDAKGKIKGMCSVKVDNVERIKSDKDNCYMLNGEKYEALRGDVPAAVNKAFGIGAVSIQKQLDGPFMLSNSNGENARYINELVNLESIDAAMGWVASKNRSLNSTIKFTNEELAQVKLCDSAQLDDCEQDTERLKLLDDKINELLPKSQLDLTEYKNHCRVADIDTSLLEYDVLTLEANLRRDRELVELGNKLFTLLNEYRRIPENLELPNISELEKLQAEIDKLNGAVVYLLKATTELNKLASDLAGLEKEKSELNNKIVGQICPCCGQIYRG